MAFKQIQMGTTIYEFPESMSDSKIAKILNSIDAGNDQPTLNEVAKPAPKLVDTGVEDDAADMKSIISAAANTVGIPESFALAIAQAESTLKPTAKNPRSSASGLFQFISSTWKAQVKEFGNKHGVMSGDILDAKSNALMGAEFIKKNIDGLTKFLGRAPTLEEVYLAHFSGLAGAKKVLKKIKASKNVSAVAAWGQAAAEANPSIFTEGASAQDVLRKLTRRATRAAEKFSAEVVVGQPLPIGEVIDEEQFLATLSQKSGLSEDELRAEETLISGREVDAEKQKRFRERLGLGEFATNVSGQMKRVEGGLFEDPDGNLVIIDDQGNRKDVGCD